jgi:tRNA modification GTPase
MHQTTLATDDVITAQASAPGSGLRAIIRMTGPETLSYLQQVITTEDHYRWDEIRKPQAIPSAITLSTACPPLAVTTYWWPTSRSFTGQPLAEIHLPGSPALVNMVLEKLYALGVRPAQRGEFTLRAFLSGRIDLLQAEAVLGVIDSHDATELQVALKQLGGNISHQMAELRSDLLNDLADLEAGLDFVEEDLDFVSRHALEQRIVHGLTMIHQLLSQHASRMTSGKLPRIILAGLPNAGKSTLYNHLGGHEQAIVSDIAGTTRDYLSAKVSLGELKVELIDTAGWESHSSGPMAQAQQQRNQLLEDADLIIWCSAANQSRADLKQDLVCLQSLHNSPIKLLHIVTKSDLFIRNSEFSKSDLLNVSVTTGDGIAELQLAILALLQSQQNEQAVLISTTSARCRDTLLKTEQALAAALALLQAGGGDELLAIELRQALEYLGEMTGAVYTNDLLDRIFSRFCIGK